MPRTTNNFDISEDYEFFLGEEMTPYSCYFTQETPLQHNQSSTATPVDDVVELDVPLWDPFQDVIHQKSFRGLMPDGFVEVFVNKHLSFQPSFFF